MSVVIDARHAIADWEVACGGASRGSGRGDQGKESHRARRKHLTAAESGMAGSVTLLGWLGPVHVVLLGAGPQPCPISRQVDHILRPAGIRRPQLSGVLRARLQKRDVLSIARRRALRFDKPLETQEVLFGGDVEDVRADFGPGRTLG